MRFSMSSFAKRGGGGGLIAAAALCGMLAMPAKAQQLTEAQQFTPGQAVLAPIAVSPVFLQNLTPVQASGLSLSGLFEQDPTVQNLSKVQAPEQANYTDAYYGAYDQFCNDNFTYISRAPENAIFEGYYSPSVNSAIFLYTPNGVGLTLQDISDILRPIYVCHYNGGTSYQTGITQGSNIYTIPATLQAGHTYSVHLEVDSRTTFNPARTNGASLFAYAILPDVTPTDNITITVTNQGPSPVTTSVGMPVTIPLRGKAAGTDGAGNVCNITENKWYWEVQSIQYSATDPSDALAPSSTATSVPYYDPDSGVSNPMDTNLHIVFTKAGYYTVTAKATDEYKSDCGNGTKSGYLAIPVTVAIADGAVHVYFDKPLIKVGRGPRSGQQKVHAYVTPLSAASSVTFSPTPQGEILLVSKHETDKDDVADILLTVQGYTGTPSDKPGGDSYFVASANGNYAASSKVLVLIPTRLSRKHPQWNVDENGQPLDPDKPADLAKATRTRGTNRALNVDTRPVVRSFSKGTVALCTRYDIEQFIEVWDQFNKILDPIYNQAEVEESKSNMDDWVNINSKIAQDAHSGYYLDYVGESPAYIEPFTNRNVFSPTENKATGWPSDTDKVTPGRLFLTKIDLDIRVDGQQLKSGVVNRKVSVTPDPNNPLIPNPNNPPLATIVISWPDTNP